MSAWLKRFGLHLAAAVGATGIFVAAAAVGANQTRQQEAMVSAPAAALRTRTPLARSKPSVVLASPTPVAVGQPPPQPGVDATSPAPLSTVAPAAPTDPRLTPGPPSARSVTPPAAPAAGQPAPGRAAATPGPVLSQPAPAEEPAEPDQSPPAAQQPPPGGPKPANAASPRPSTTARTSSSPTPTAPKVVPERSLAGTIKAVLPDGLEVSGVGGREWHVTPAPGALIRLNGKTARLDILQPGDTVVILGQAQSGAPANRFLAHAITARRK